MNIQNKYRKYFSELVDNGYTVVDCENYDTFQLLCNDIGTTFNITDIKVSELRAKLSSSSAMTLHTDHPYANHIGWYCKQAADFGGASVILDWQLIEKRLTNSNIDLLRGVMLKVPGQSDQSAPMLTSQGIYYANWLVCSPITSDDRRTAYDNFIRELENTPPNKILLKEGQALFINNKRFLHGRDAFKDIDKQRLLIRHWLK